MNALQTKPSRSIPISAKEERFFSARTPLTNIDFWSFYVEHQDFIDMLISAGSNRYQAHYDVEDIRQEVLYRLHINNVLEQYKPAIAQLNTFLTSKIRNYIRHAVRDIDASEPLVESEEFNEYNHGSSKDDFGSLSFRDALEKLKAKVSPELWAFVCKLQQGWTASEIARTENVTRSCIQFKYMRVLKSKAIRKLFEE